MKYVVFLGLLLGSLNARTLLGAPQHSGGLGGVGVSQIPTGNPPGPFGREGTRLPQPDAATAPEPVKLKRRFDANIARKHAQQMADLAGKIPGEVEQLSKNVLPQDLARQLKQIEKLAKSLRSQINP